jgi:hypothetical protein
MKSEVAVFQVVAEMPNRCTWPGGIYEAGEIQVRIVADYPAFEAVHGRDETPGLFREMAALLFEPAREM